MGTPAYIRAMLDPSFYPHKVDRVELVQTHISWILLTGDYAYKVKKPVRFEFLDFSTPQLRKRYCELEWSLNRRLAPQLYLGVHTIVRSHSGYALDGKGEAVDWCVRMLQFDQRDLLDRRLHAGRFNPEWMDMLANDIADFHMNADRCRQDWPYGTPPLIKRYLLENLESIQRSPVAQKNELARLQDDYRRWMAALNETLLTRKERGFVRACHGDLHLRNITLLEGKPVVFDCIEFNEELRWIDVMNDVAFLVMDCDARARSDLGYRFLSRYLEHTGDYSGLELLRLYASYRAAVRCKVACLTAEDPGLPRDEKEAQLREAKRYLSLALGYHISFRPTLYVIGGLSGSGKSHLALQALKHTPAVIIRSDATRKRLAKKYPGEALYGPQMNARTYGAMFKAGEIALADGFNVILDATFLRREDRDRARELAKKLHADIRILWLDVPEPVLRQRIQQRIRKGKDVSDADLEVLELQLQHYKRPRENDVLFLPDSDRWPFQSTSAA